MKSSKIFAGKAMGITGHEDEMFNEEIDVKDEESKRRLFKTNNLTPEAKLDFVTGTGGGRSDGFRMMMGMGTQSGVVGNILGGGNTSGSEGFKMMMGISPAGNSVVGNIMGDRNTGMRLDEKMKLFGMRGTKTKGSSPLNTLKQYGLGMNIGTSKNSNKFEYFGIKSDKGSKNKQNPMDKIAYLGFGQKNSVTKGKMKNPMGNKLQFFGMPQGNVLQNPLDGYLPTFTGTGFTMALGGLEQRGWQAAMQPRQDMYSQNMWNPLTAAAGFIAKKRKDRVFRKGLESINQPKHGFRIIPKMEKVSEGETVEEPMDEITVKYPKGRKVDVEYIKKSERPNLTGLQGVQINKKQYYYNPKRGGIEYGGRLWNISPTDTSVTIEGKKYAVKTYAEDKPSFFYQLGQYTKEHISPAQRLKERRQEESFKRVAKQRAYEQAEQYARKGEFKDVMKKAFLETPGAVEEEGMGGSVSVRDPMTRKWVKVPSKYYFGKGQTGIRSRGILPESMGALSAGSSPFGFGTGISQSLSGFGSSGGTEGLYFMSGGGEPTVPFWNKIPMLTQMPGSENISFGGGMGGGTTLGDTTSKASFGNRMFSDDLVLQQMRLSIPAPPKVSPPSIVYRQEPIQEYRQEPVQRYQAETRSTKGTLYSPYSKRVVTYTRGKYNKHR